MERLAREYACDPAAFYEEPPPIEPLSRESRDDRGRRVLDLAWPSTVRPFLAPFAERYLETEENCVAAARLFTRARPRPVAVLIHGFMSGHFALEQRIWPIDELDRLGFDVALFVLPFHGVRAAKGRQAPEFPGIDPRFTNEGFRQAVFDLRTLIRALYERGHPAVGLLGMSLGGYTAALTATLEPRLAFVVPVIPLASLADFSREQGFLVGSPDEVATLHALLERVHHVVSPFARSSRVPRERVLVVGARADRITPIAHARRIAGHFGAELFAFRGGHLLQLGRRESFDRVFALLERVRDGN
nr:MAG: hypothetical protein DIU78_14160 [Pseudomonadota bacterium]